MLQLRSIRQRPPVQNHNVDWLRYQRLLQQSTAHIAKLADTTNLLKLSQQLTTLRLSLVDNSLSLLKEHADLPPSVEKIELTLLLCQHYQWPKPIWRLLLQAAFCSILVRAMPQQQQWPSLLPFPALAAARLLQLNGQNTSLLTVLAGCYPSERKQASWLQNPLSLVLTQAEYLSDNRKGSEPLLQRIGIRIALSNSEYELRLLQHILCYLTLTATLDNAVTDDHLTDNTDLISNAKIYQLFAADNKDIEHYLRQSAALGTTVLARASQLNRLKTQVVDLHLALNLLGRTQLPHILTEAELHANLMQLHQPNQLILQQFSAIVAYALSVLLPAKQHSIAYWQALSLCISAPLWLDNTSYASALLVRTKTGFRIRISDNHYQKPDTQQLVFGLLRQYNLSEWQPAAQHWLQPEKTLPNSQQSLALQLAWYSGIAVLTNQIPQQLPPLISRAQQSQLLSHNLSNWLLQLASHCQCYCPLQLSL